MTGSIYYDALRTPRGKGRIKTGACRAHLAALIRG